MHFSIHNDVYCEKLIKGKNCERTHDRLTTFGQWHPLECHC